MKTRNPFQTARHTISEDSKAVPALVFLALLLPGWSLPLLALESPTSDGPVSQLDGPVFRIPLMRKRPEIDADPQWVRNFNTWIDNGKLF